MTKMKSKKMTKSTFAIVIMAIVMVAMLAFGGTYAYFTANSVGESVGNIRTAQLELHNQGTDGAGARLQYDSTKEIVPGDYAFGDGILNPTTSNPTQLETDITDWQKIHLFLGRNSSDKFITNAAAYAFVTINVSATGASDKPLMVQYTEGGDTKYTPVLRLIPRLDSPKSSDMGSPYTSRNDEDDAQWEQFGVGEIAEASASTYIFYFVLKDTDDSRNRFEDIDFEFALQFDPKVMADRRQWTTTEEKDYWMDEANGGYIEAKDWSDEGAARNNILERTNVYEELTSAANGGTPTYSTKFVSIMGVNISFDMHFGLIQQTGFDNPVDAYHAFIADFGEGIYTDNNLTPGDGV